MTSIISPRIQAALFDLDDTLYDRGAAFENWAAEFVAVQNGDWDAGERDAAVVFLVAADGAGYAPRPDFFAAVRERFPSAAGQSVDEFVSAFRAGMLRNIHLEHGARVLIDSLDTGGIPWGIITNGSNFPQQRKVDHMGLTARAACTLISESFGEKKPHPAIFLAAAAKLAATPNEIFFVGDHAVNDIGGAQQVGMQTAWLRRGRQWPADITTSPPDFLVDDLSELVPFPPVEL